MDIKQYLALDIGGTTIKYGVVDALGTFMTHGLITNRIRSHGVATMLEDIVAVAKEMQSQYQLTAVGISTSGVVDIATGEILRSADTFPGYTNCNPGKIITEATGLPCIVDNDVNCAVLGEYYYGAAIKKSSVCCLTVGTGIGGATLLEGKLLYGKTYFAGEIGHFPVVGGELEKVASTSALVRRVAAAKGLPIAEVNGKKIFAWALAGDKAALEGIEIMVQALAQGIVYLLYGFNPEIVVIGGAVAAQEAYLKPMLMEKLSAMALPELLEATEIAFSKLENKASMLGAVAPYLEMEK